MTGWKMGKRTTFDGESFDAVRRGFPSVTKSYRTSSLLLCWQCPNLNCHREPDESGVAVQLDCFVADAPRNDN